MSEFLRAAREKLRGALADIDARLAELQAFKAEEAQLCDHRAQLVTLLGDPVPAEERPVYRPEPGAVTTVASGTAPTHGTRYSLPGQDAAPADSEGDRGGRRGRAGR